MSRAFLGWCLCVLALSTGLYTAALAVENRARGADLDRLERWCETQSRKNELARVANQRQEWRLLGQEKPLDPADPLVASEAGP